MENNNPRRITVPRSLDLGTRQYAYNTVVRPRSTVVARAPSAKPRVNYPVGYCAHNALYHSNTNQTPFRQEH